MKSPLSQQIDDLLEIGFRQTCQIRPHITDPLAEHRERHVSPDGPHIGLDDLVCRLLLEKKKNTTNDRPASSRSRRSSRKTLPTDGTRSTVTSVSALVRRD